jgi:four helix bundle protein
MAVELPYEKLDVYRVAIELFELVTTMKPPKGAADYYDQLKRATSSIVLNIAEGCGRDGPDRKRVFLIARGSALESAASLRLLQSCGVSSIIYHQGRELAGRLYAMLSRLAGKSL